MKTRKFEFSIILVLVMMLSIFAMACEEDTTDGDTTDGDATTDGDVAVDGDVTVDGDTATDGDVAIDGDTTTDDGDCPTNKAGSCTKDMAWGDCPFPSGECVMTIGFQINYTETKYANGMLVIMDCTNAPTQPCDVTIKNNGNVCNAYTWDMLAEDKSQTFVRDDDTITAVVNDDGSVTYTCPDTSTLEFTAEQITYCNENAFDIDCSMGCEKDEDCFEVDTTCIDEICQ